MVTSQVSNGQAQNDPLMWDLPPTGETESTYNDDLPDEDTYVLQLVSVSKPFENSYDATKERRVWKFVVTDDAINEESQVGKEVGVFYTMTSSAKGNLYPIVKAMMGGEIDPKMGWNPGVFMNRKLKGTVTYKINKETGNKSATIEGAVAYRPRGMAQKTTEPTEAPF